MTTMRGSAKRKDFEAVKVPKKRFFVWGARNFLNTEKIDLGSQKHETLFGDKILMVL